MGSGAVRQARELIEDGALGEIRGIGASGAWQRTSAYYDRARWAGKRSLDGVPVVDGALTNPFPFGYIEQHCSLRRLQIL